MADHKWIERALELARQADYATTPNPMVGAVIVDARNQVVGEAFHARASEPHAEVLALRQAGERAQGATLYLNLEPCAHQGRTPPCVAEVIAHRIRRAVISMIDPNPLVNGAGVRRLREAGVEVEIGPGAQQARRLNEFFLKWVTTGRPFVAVKFAMSLDGKIATTSRESRWISGEAARHHAHELRHCHDAILVGINTVLADDPLLTARHAEGARQPVRVVVDSKLRIPIASRLLDPFLPARTLIACTEAAPADRRHELEQRGVEVLVTCEREGRVDLEQLLRLLAERELISLLVDGGGEVTAGFLEAGLVDRVYAYVAPLILGGREAPPAVGGQGVVHLAEGIRLSQLSVERLDDDLLLTGDVHRDR